MGKFERKKDAVKDYFDDRSVFSKTNKHEKAVIANSQKMHNLCRKLDNINIKIEEIDNKPKRRHMNFGEGITTFALGTILPVGVALASISGAATTPDSTTALKDTLDIVGQVAIHSTPAVALATYLTREFKVASRTFDALKKRSLIKRAQRVQEDINTCKIYQIGLTGQEDPIAENILERAKAKMPKNTTRPDPNFQYLDTEITEDNIEEYMQLDLE